ncbi:hypothetical protein EOD41_15235 [Mucilaginibacter limnophilus]|uniref:Uncharacterized protein n=1 Tax=Mucilaginibacter limnophilus TaxID=1932778 RepID=A0A437MQ74_9SPHI|nr:hypothetical protein [Mucilaginibacter limnophilus]RVT99794.1 hypothetical protein EOD41_15235 [Mucilaginibacter limnophilus]
MYIAYSALCEAELQPKVKDIYNKPNQCSQADDAKLEGYLAACAKYRHEIAAIQQHFPGWLPEF